MPMSPPVSSGETRMTAPREVSGSETPLERSAPVASTQYWRLSTRAIDCPGLSAVTPSSAQANLTGAVSAWRLSGTTAESTPRPCGPKSPARASSQVLDRTAGPSAARISRPDSAGSPDWASVVPAIRHAPRHATGSAALERIVFFMMAPELQIVAQDDVQAVAIAPALGVRQAVAGNLVVVEPDVSGAVLAAAIEEAVGTAVQPVLGDLQPDLVEVAAAVGRTVPDRRLDVCADHVPEALGQRRATGSAQKPAAVVIAHPARLLHAHRVVLVAQQPAQRRLEDIALHNRFGQRRTGARRRQRVDPAQALDDGRVSAVPGRVGHDPAHHVAAVGMRQHDQVGDVAAGDEIMQLAGQAPGGGRIPHVLGEVAVDHDVIGLV